MVSGHLFEKVVNDPARHTLSHLYFTVNYGQVSSLNKCPHSSILTFSQYFTWAARVGGSYRQPQSELDPLLEVKALDDNEDLWLRPCFHLMTTYLVSPQIKLSSTLSESAHGKIRGNGEKMRDFIETIEPDRVGAHHTGNPYRTRRT
jgi:hypothetical protein